MMKKRIAILGSTGSIGTQALEVIAENAELFEVEVLTANNNADLLIQQAKKFTPNTVVIADQTKYKYVSEALADEDIKVFAGADSMAQIVEMETVDVVLTALVGFSGLRPTINAVKKGKTIALANKETLVVAGELVNKAAMENHSLIIPVDSEHSAIFQCLTGESYADIEKIYLTASGGPFRGKSKEYLATVTKEQALKHPNWTMGAKITIDSATLMNKGLEVIEAKWLFGLKNEQIDVIVHPQSIIHSMVQFKDGSIKAQMGLPDMKLPIHYAFSFPRRVPTELPRFDFMKYPSFTFEPPDKETFRNLELAYHAMERGGNVPCILNAANEIAVAGFLRDRVGFMEITEIIETCMAKIAYIQKPAIEDYFETDRETRAFAESLIGQKV